MKYNILVFIGLFFSSFWGNAAELGVLTSEQLQQLQQTSQPLVVDIRTESEWQATGIIPNSVKLQSFDKEGKFNADQWLESLDKLKSSPDQTVVLVCRSGNRSSKVGDFLVNKGFNHVYHLQKGIDSWIKSGLPVNQN